MWGVPSSSAKHPDESKRDEYRAENTPEESPLTATISPEVAEVGVFHGLAHPRTKSDGTNLYKPHNELRGQKTEDDDPAESAESDAGCEDAEHLTRHKISDRWRKRAWLQVECGSHRKWERGAASGSLHRLVRRIAWLERSGIDCMPIGKDTRRRTLPIMEVCDTALWHGGQRVEAAGPKTCERECRE